MKKQYFEPQLEIKRFSFENILATTESGYPIEETVATEKPDIGGPVDPGEDPFG